MTSIFDITPWTFDLVPFGTTTLQTVSRYNATTGIVARAKDRLKAARAELADAKAVQVALESEIAQLDRMVAAADSATTANDTTATAS